MDKATGIQYSSTQHLALRQQSQRYWRFRGVTLYHTAEAAKDKLSSSDFCLITPKPQSLEKLKACSCTDKQLCQQTSLFILTLKRKLETHLNAVVAVVVVVIAVVHFAVLTAIFKILVLYLNERNEKEQRGVCRQTC